MISIENISKVPQREGEQRYRVALNDRTIATFTHRREESMSTLFRRAADALDALDRNELFPRMPHEDEA